MLNVVLLETFDKHAPLKSIQARKVPAPWITVELKEAMKKRNAARRLWRRRRDDNSYRNFKKLRNEVQCRVRSAKSAYYLDAFKRSGNSVETWKRLRYLGLIKAREANEPLHSVNDFFVKSTCDSYDFGDSVALIQCTPESLMIKISIGATSHRVLLEMFFGGLDLEPSVLTEYHLN